MFKASADLYDRVYRTFKDYAAESERLTRVLHAEQPRCRTLLDVACGTGEHAYHLGVRGFAVDGLDLDDRLLAVAAAKNPSGRYVRGDMATFDLGRQYDAVLCLFSSIGYAVTLERVTAALARFRHHLAPGGLVVVEPWFEPGVLDPGRVDTRTVATPDGTITRQSRVELSDMVSRLIFHYEIVRGDRTETVTEYHELGLFTRAQMTLAFDHAGLSVRYDPEGLTGRGLYLARVS